MILYNPILEYLTKDQILGKYSTCIRVVTLKGERLGLKDILTRWMLSADFFRLFCFKTGFLGALFSGLTEYRKYWSDLRANTAVMFDRPLSKIQLKDFMAILNHFNLYPTYLQAIRFKYEDMLLIKNTIKTVIKYPYSEIIKRFAIELADKISSLIEFRRNSSEKNRIFTNFASRFYHFDALKNKHG